jgi:hypothetical protein
VVVVEGSEGVVGRVEGGPGCASGGDLGKLALPQQLVVQMQVQLERLLVAVAVVVLLLLVHLDSVHSTP